MNFRYARAFWKALVLTLRGQTISAPPDKQPQIHAWMRQGAAITERVREAAERTGISIEARRALTLHLDKRDISLETALQTVRHHLTAEYPYLLRHYTRFSVMTIQASNLNDQYLITSFAAVETLPTPVRQALTSLHEHLLALPPAEPEPESGSE